MTQRLELKQVRGTPENIPARRWYFERGTRTLGRSGDCNWQIPDPARQVSKLHCTIEADASGFLLRDNSANGSLVDGQRVMEGETARLGEGSVIELGPFAFAVSLRGERDAELADPQDNLVLGDESLTISSILADVAPRSGRASGLYGGHDVAGEVIKPNGPRMSREVEIGWSGPPETNAPKPTLPLDWDTESGLSNTIEHNSATRVAVPVFRSAPATGGLPEETPLQLPAADTIHEAAEAPEIAALVARNERAHADLLEALGLDAPRADRTLSLETRLETLQAQQAALALAVSTAIEQLSDTLEPWRIEARAGEQKRLFQNGEKAAWLSYRNQFEENGQRQALKTLFAHALMRAMPGSSVPGDTEPSSPFTEVKPNR